MTEETRRDFTLTWTLDAPRADAFGAWTDPDHVDRLAPSSPARRRAGKRELGRRGGRFGFVAFC